MKKFILLYSFYLFSMPVASSPSLPVMSFEEQIIKAQAIARVKLVEAKYSTERSSIKELLVEVVDGIYNLKTGDKIKLLGHTSIHGSEIGFNCLGSQAIIIMEKMDPNYRFKGFYGSVNRDSSVYHIKGEKVSGFGYFSIDYESALAKVKDALHKQSRDDGK